MKWYKIVLFGVLIVFFAGSLILLIFFKNSIEANFPFIIALVNLSLVGITALYVVFTGELLLTSRKQLVLSHKPTLIVSFQNYSIGYYSKNGDMNITFKFIVKNPSSNPAFDIKGDFIVKLGDSDNLIQDSHFTYTINEDLMIFFPSGKDELQYECNCLVPKFLLRDKNYLFEFRGKIKYRSTMGVEHFTIASYSFEINIESRYMTGDLVYSAKTFEFK